MFRQQKWSIIRIIHRAFPGFVFKAIGYFFLNSHKNSFQFSFETTDQSKLYFSAKYFIHVRFVLILNKCFVDVENIFFFDYATKVTVALWKIMSAIKNFGRLLHPSQTHV